MDLNGPCSIAITPMFLLLDGNRLDVLCKCCEIKRHSFPTHTHTNHGRKMWISPRSSLSHVLTPPWWSVTIRHRLSFPQFGTMHVLQGWLVVVGDGQFMFRLHQERIGPQLPWPWVLGPPASKLLPLKVRGPNFPKWPMSWQRAAISKEYLSQRSGCNGSWRHGASKSHSACRCLLVGDITLMRFIVVASARHAMSIDLPWHAGASSWLGHWVS